MLSPGGLKDHVMKDFKAVGDIPIFMSKLMGNYLTKHRSRQLRPPTLLCAWVLSLLSPVGLFGTPRTVARQAPLPMGFSRQECWSGLLHPPPGDLPRPGIEPTPLISPALACWFFITGVTWEAQSSLVWPNK